MRLVWDIETDGLLRELTRIHCIVAADPDTGKEYAYRPHEIQEGLKFLSTADSLIGHNILDFDLRAVRKLYPEWRPKPGCVVRDTLLMTRLHRPDTGDIDAKLVRFRGMPPKLRNSHSLEAWGFRVGVQKDAFGKTADWSVFTEEMFEYAKQDVRANVALWNFIERQGISPHAVKLEHALAPALLHQEETGFGFRAEQARLLYAKLQDREAVVAEQLREFIPPWWQPGRVLTNKVTKAAKLPHFEDVTVARVSKAGKPLAPYVGPPKETRIEGTQFQNIKWVEFSPSARAQLGERLTARYGWVPEQFNKDGSAKLDDAVIQSIPETVLPVAMRDLLLEFYMLGKIGGYIGKGAQSWLKHYNEATGSIHGRVIQNGAVTGRATHRNPNVAQAPKVHFTADKPPVPILGHEGGWGFECRSLFVPRDPSLVLVGCDMSGLELRCLAHYLALMGDTDYVQTVTSGDPHTFHMKLAGLPTRDVAKTWIYAFLYGAGAWRLGHIADPTLPHSEKSKLGKALKNRFLKNFPALSELTMRVKATAEERRYLVGIDGRRLYIRSLHSSLNTLLQSAGSIACKQWLVELHRSLPEEGLVVGRDVFQHAWVHDEVQLSTRQELGTQLGQLARKAAVRSGEALGFKCPLSGEFKIGSDWAETH